MVVMKCNWRWQLKYGKLIVSYNDCKIVRLPIHILHVCMYIKLSRLFCVTNFDTYYLDILVILVSTNLYARYRSLSDLEITICLERVVNYFYYSTRIKVTMKITTSALFYLSFVSFLPKLTADRIIQDIWNCASRISTKSETKARSLIQINHVWFRKLRKQLSLSEIQC